MKQLPNLLTLMNLFLGCMAVLFTMQSGIMPMYGETGSPLVNSANVQFINLPENITVASFLIIGAAVIDFFDGFVARWLKAESELGKQLDSLADLISFGVAPSLIMYQFLRLSYAQQENGLDVSIIWLLPVFLIACTAAYRLARFNIDPDQKLVFRGLPVPAAGLTIASIPLIYWYTDKAWLINLVLNKWILYLVVLGLSGLMISRITLLSLKIKQANVKKSMPQLFIVLIAVISAILLKWAFIPVTVAIYIIVSLFLKKR